MSGSVTPYNITPTLGVALNQTYLPAGSPLGGTGPQFPTPGMQFGMTVGKVMRGNDSNQYILVVNGNTQLAANAAVTTGPPNFVVGTGTGVAGTAPNFVIPPNALFWANIGL